jgi:hypothetical protein
MRINAGEHKVLERDNSKIHYFQKKENGNGEQGDTPLNREDYTQAKTDFITKITEQQKIQLRYKGNKYGWEIY